MADAFVLLGSNIQKEIAIRSATQFLNDMFHCFAQSKIHLFPAVEADGSISTTKPDFFNCVVGFKTDLPVSDLVRLCRGFEARMGRVRTEDKFAPRFIDMDVLVYDGEVLEKDMLKYPHVFLPLSEVLPL